MYLINYLKYDDCDKMNNREDGRTMEVKWKFTFDKH